MDEVIRTELDKLTGLIINAIPVEQIFLFGSYAYGKPRKDSDLDLYVDIIAKKKKDFLDRLDNITLERKVNRDGIRIYG
jgi:predicted nucleotidyltransferase